MEQPKTAPTGTDPEASPTAANAEWRESDTYDLAVWHTDQPIGAASAREKYISLASDFASDAERTAVGAFIEAFGACFLDVTHDSLPPVPGGRSVFVPALRCECYVFDAGVYLSFPADLAPDITPVICHLAEQAGVVVYDRQRQGVFLPPTIEVTWTRRATAGDGFVIAHDPTAADLPTLVDAADQSDWFLILERDADHYLQAAPEGLPSGGPGTRAWSVEFREGHESTHHVSKGASLDEVKQAFVLYAVGGSSWKDGLSWSRLMA